MLISIIVKMLLWEEKFPPGKGDCLKIFLRDITTCSKTKRKKKERKNVDSDFYTNANYNLKGNKEALFLCARPKEALFIKD